MSENRATGLLPVFYRRLLDLSGPEEADRILGRVVELLARRTGAELAYLEILDLGDELRLGYSAAGEGLEAIRARISREIVRQVAVRVEPIAVASAIDDDRLRDLEGVRCNGLRAVLCVPLEPIAGALYLQGPAPFSPADQEHAARCARQLGEQLLGRHGRADRLSLRRLIARGRSRPL
ncbi:MAG TPA: GAF domain-containing protein [Kofleriaceae bacterium]|nr:GAF domain-containing protein [Kofleriaceae bacterium]